MFSLKGFSSSSKQNEETATLTSESNISSSTTKSWALDFQKLPASNSVDTATLKPSSSFLGSGTSSQSKRFDFSANPTSAATSVPDGSSPPVTTTSTFTPSANTPPTNASIITKPGLSKLAPFAPPPFHASTQQQPPMRQAEKRLLPNNPTEENNSTAVKSPPPLSLPGRKNFSLTTDLQFKKARVVDNTLEQRLVPVTQSQQQQQQPIMTTSKSLVAGPQEDRAFLEVSNVLQTQSRKIKELELQAREHVFLQEQLRVKISDSQAATQQAQAKISELAQHVARLESQLEHKEKELSLCSEQVASMEKDRSRMLSDNVNLSKAMQEEKKRFIHELQNSSQLILTLQGVRKKDQELDLESLTSSSKVRLMESQLLESMEECQKWEQGCQVVLGILDSCESCSEKWKQMEDESKMPVLEPNGKGTAEEQEVLEGVNQMSVQTKDCEGADEASAPGFSPQQQQ